MKPDSQRMTPTAQIAAIRQRTEDAWTNGCTIDEATAAVFDRATLMDIWDTHQSALRALVAQWKQEVADAAEACEPDADERAAVWDDCADQLERLLESEQ